MQRSWQPVVVLMFGLTGLLCGCAAKSGKMAAPPAVMSLDVRSEVIGRSLQGREIECLTIGDGPVMVMMLATIHGDESAGTPLLRMLAADAALAPPWMRDRTLVLVPVVNPDGFALDRRGNAHGVDLNRNFPATSFTSRRRHGAEPLSEPESLALHDAILHHRPQRIISMHQPLACIDYDGDAAALAQAMADAIREPHRVKVSKLGAYPGSLGSFAGEDLGIPTITVELPGPADRLADQELWSRYGEMLIAAVAYP